MSTTNHPVVRRRLDGSIDLDHYDRIARDLRVRDQRAVLESLVALVTRLFGASWPRPGGRRTHAEDRVKLAASAQQTFSSAYHRERLPRTASIAFASALLIVGTGAGQGETPPITAEPLIERHSFSGEVTLSLTQTLDGLERHEVEMTDASSLAVVEFTIQPGAVFPWHTHPGTVLISLAQGELDFIFAEDCVERRLAPGTAMVDPGNAVHSAHNPGDVPTIVIATLLGAPAEGSVTIPVDADEAAALDERCDIETPGEHAH